MRLISLADKEQTTMYDRVATQALKPFIALLLTAGVSLPVSATEQQRCYQGLCAKLSVAAACPEPGEHLRLHLEGTLADTGNFAVTTYELLTNANWTYLDNHQIQLNGYDKMLSNDGFVMGGRFDKSLDIDPLQAQRYTLIHRYRSSSHGYFATAAELTLDPAANCVQMQIDIKPGSCPNPVNIDQKGLTPVAIVGSTTLDVRSLDLTSIRLDGVAPVKYSYEDVTAVIPNKASIYDCSTSRSDGIADLSLKFKTQELAAALEARLGRQPLDGELITLELSASSKAGAVLRAKDSIQALVKGKR